MRNKNLLAVPIPPKDHGKGTLEFYLSIHVAVVSIGNELKDWNGPNGYVKNISPTKLEQSQVKWRQKLIFATLYTKWVHCVTFLYLGV